MLLRLYNNIPRFLFDTVAKLTQSTPANSSSLTADDFMNFLTSKIDSIRDHFTGPYSVYQNPGEKIFSILVNAGTAT